MRDAFGGAFMIKLFLVFILIYVCFTAMALNYAKAFRVKNKVIDYIEKNEIVDITSMSATAYNEMNDYFEKELFGGSLNYRNDKNITCKSDNKKGQVEYCQNGITIIKYDPKNVADGSNKLGVYYKVSVEVAWKIPFLNRLLNISGEEGDVETGIWVVSGETRTIVRE